MTGANFGELNLVACEPVTSHGFALPLFGQGARANTLYVARCDPTGDHAGRITGFELYEPAHPLWLPESLWRTASVGDSWLDVFLWDDPLATGTPAEIWGILETRFVEVSAEAPLSLLDAAIHAARPERDAIAAAARDYVITRFGNSRAKRWGTDLTRRTIEVALAHAACSSGLAAGPKSAVVSLRVEADPDAGTVTLALPGGFPAALVELLDRVFTDNRRLATALEIELRSLGLGVSAAAVAAESSEFGSDAEWPDAPEEAGREHEGILILAIGRRARAIARHFEVPGWWPETLRPFETDSELRIDSRIRQGNAPLPVEIITAERSGRLPSISGEYALVVVLVDDDEREDALFLSALQRAMSGIAPGTLMLLAPALPEEFPSSVMLDATHGSLKSFHALLDTSQARSPFWWGNSRRSLDRRVADIVIGGALLSLALEIRHELTARSREAPFVLAFAVAGFSAPALREEIMLASETTWVHRSASRLLFSHQISLHGRGQEGPEQVALVEGRVTEVHFDEFAREVLGEIFRGAGAGYRERSGTLPKAEQWLSEPPPEFIPLRFPAHAVGLRLSRDGKDLRLLVTAETPALASVSTAKSAGWNLVRYTDRETLTMIVTPGTVLPALPAEIRLSSLRSSSMNRRLVTRGVDQRDVIRLTEHQLQEWLDAAPQVTTATMLAMLRKVRATGSMRSDLTYALRREDLRALEQQDHHAAVQLHEILRLRDGALAGRYKRLGDLDVCWLLPARGRKRYAILDGELPSIVIRLEPGEIVLQGAFIVDGDEGALTLFRSRAFSVWARATLSRSSSWMSRFSVGATFGGFPFPRGFQILEEEGLTTLDSSEAGSEFAGFAREIETLVERELARTAEGAWKLAHRIEESAPMRQADEVILRLYDLPPEADELNILTRLSELNDRF